MISSQTSPRGATIIRDPLESEDKPDPLAQHQVVGYGLPCGKLRELFAELDIAGRFQSDCLVPAPDEAVPVADVNTAAIIWVQRENLDMDTRKLMGELRKRFGKAVRIPQG